MHHQCLRPADDELVHTSNGMRTNLGAVMLEELKEFRDKDVEGTIESIRIQSLG